MIKQLKTYQLFIFILWSALLQGQISPGPLSQAHADLEGISNCTQCHDLGNKVPDNKCLACHETIDNLIKQNRGYHSSKEVQNRTCVECHNEHHGRKFEMVRFDEDNFNHSLTNYELEGAHGSVDCRKCHTPDNIKDSETRSRENTFLGLDDKCLTCHDDFHQGTLDNDCRKCHDLDAFRPASNFDHDDTKFVLDGAHTDVDCKECHPIEFRKGVEFQKFADVAFNDCNSCHDDVHNGNLPGKCSSCHTTTDFLNKSKVRKFNHNVTNFRLKGSHKSVDCFTCHQSNVSPQGIFQDQIGISENSCNSCHDDVHDGKFGLDCAKCHNEESFLTLNDMDFFDHSLTDYPLEGQHLNVDCKECHTGRYTDEIVFTNCFDCHDDYHEGQFTEGGVRTDCKECHTLEEKFTYTVFGPDDHADTSFPLNGSHLATPCFACHVSEDKWSFRSIGESCVDCHDNIHKDIISEKYFPEQNCTACHNEEAWAAVDFDHTQTNWKLEGEHEKLNCRACHFEYIEENDIFKQEFAGLNSNCANCHDNIHGTQFEIEGITDCKRCHSPISWSPEYFDHSNTNFPLEGRHAEIDCNACHKDEVEIDGRYQINYIIESYQCIDCHS